MTSTGRRERLAAAALLVLCLAVLFHRALLNDETFVDRDLRRYYRPAKSLVAPLVQESGGIPFWNPYFASGQPFAANPEHEVFFPLTWLFLVLPFEWAFRLQVILPPLVTAFGMRFLLRTLGRSRAASLFGALAWGFGGYVVSATNLLPCLHTVALLPFGLAFLVRAVRSGRRSDVAGAGLSFGAMALSAEPATLMASTLLALAALVHARRWRAEGRGRAVLLAASAGLLALAIGSAALIPALHLVTKTPRAAGLPAAATDVWSFPPARIAEFVAPHALGHVERDDVRWFWGAPLYPDKRFPYWVSVYFGLLGALLAPIAVVLRPRRIGAWGAAAIAGVLVGVGPALPFWPALRRLVPPLASIRFPEKFLLLTIFSAVVAAAFGFDALCARRRNRVRKVTFAALGGVAVLAALSLAAVPLATRADPGVWMRLGAPAAIAGAVPSTLQRDALVLLVTALAYAAAAAARRRAAPLLVLVTAADLLVTLAPAIRTSPAAVESRIPPFLAAYHARAVEGPLFEVPPNRLLDLVPPREVAEPPMPAFWRVPMAFEEDFDLTQLRWSLAATYASLEAMARDPRSSLTFLARRGVGAVSGPVVDGDGARMELMPLRDPRPFATCASGVGSVSDTREWADQVARLGMAGRDVVFLERPAQVPAISPGQAHLLARTPVRVEVDVRASGPRPALLALAQSWDDGWTAAVDGTRVPLLRVDLSFTGVLVAPGDHRVSFVYRDQRVIAGVGLSIIGLLVAAFLAWTGSASRRRSD